MLFSCSQAKNLTLIMVFHRKFLNWGRQKIYFHVKILILVCPNRTCKNFENRLTNKVFMAKINFDRDFALAREIIEDRENAYFSRIFT